MKILHKTPLTHPDADVARHCVIIFIFIFLKPDTCVMDTNVARYCVIILILILKKF